MTKQNPETTRISFFKNKKVRTIRVDKLLGNLIIVLNGNDNIETLGCCCGHHKYPLTIVVKDHRGVIWELISGKTIPRTKRFYFRDKQGIFYIPETIE